MGVSWFGSRARQDRVNNRAKGMSLSVKGISPRDLSSHLV